MLNHTLLTVERILADGLPCGGVILNNPDGAEDEVARENRAILEELMEVRSFSRLSRDKRL